MASAGNHQIHELLLKLENDTPGVGWEETLVLTSLYKELQKETSL